MKTWIEEAGERKYKDSTHSPRQRNLYVNKVKILSPWN
jgi:hypothetical protein